MTWFQSIVLLISHFLGKIQYADFKMKHCIFLRGQIVRQEIWAKRWHPFKNFVRRDPTCYIAPGIRFDSLSFFNKSVGGGRKWKRGPVLLRVCADSLACLVTLRTYGSFGFQISPYIWPWFDPLTEFINQKPTMRLLLLLTALGSQLPIVLANGPLS